MATLILRQLRTAIRHLNPGEVRQDAARPLSIGLAAISGRSLTAMEDFLAPPEISRRKRLQIFESLHRVGDPGRPSHYDLVILEEGLPETPGAFPFYASDPERTVREILKERKDLALPLARTLFPFRKPVVDGIIRDISRENALFALFTALPSAIPNIFSLGWAASEFASDTVVLTLNQVRMAILIAAASDSPVGFLEQKRQIGAIVAGAFGWRALARELAGKIPFGQGLIPKASIAYAGTYVAGVGLDRYHRIGASLTSSERAAAYRQALESGRRFARWALESERGRER